METLLTINGEVIDVEGEGVAAAAITLQSEDLTLSSLSSFEGQFRFKSITPGTYTLSAEHEELGKVTLRGLEISDASEQFWTLELE